jgi:hypothetical protein
MRQARLLFLTLLLLAGSVLPLQATAIYDVDGSLTVSVIGYLLDGVPLADKPDDLLVGDLTTATFASTFAIGSAFATATATALVNDTPLIDLFVAVAGAADGLSDRAASVALSFGSFEFRNTSSVNTYDILLDIAFGVNGFVSTTQPGETAFAFLFLFVDVFGGNFDFDTFTLRLGPSQSALIEAGADLRGFANVPEPATLTLAAAGLALLAVGLRRRRTRRVQ